MERKTVCRGKIVTIPWGPPRGKTPALYFKTDNPYYNLFMDEVQFRFFYRGAEIRNGYKLLWFLAKIGQEVWVELEVREVLMNNVSVTSRHYMSDHHRLVPPGYHLTNIKTYSKHHGLYYKIHFNNPYESRPKKADRILRHRRRRSGLEP